MSTLFSDENKLFAKKHSFLDIPPRKLFLTKSHDYDSNLLKFLPCTDSGESGENLAAGGCGLEADSDMDPYSSDHFRMYEFKIRRCTRSRSHDWTDCPFAHPGEKARRRDPRKYHYSGQVCPEFRRGSCSRGDSCEFAHGVFECWLHPSRYRTEACKDGRNCKRKVCFFAHTPRQLRLLPEVPPPQKGTASAAALCGHGCCVGCHSMLSSPTSTLLAANNYSPPLSPSPPMSPVSRGGGGGFSRHVDRLSKLGSGVYSYKDVLNELMNSLEAMSFSDGAAVSPSPVSAGRNYFSDGAAVSPSPMSAGRNYFSDGSPLSSPISATNFNANPWIDYNSSFNGDDHQQNLNNLSPSHNATQNPCINGDLLAELGKEMNGKEEVNNGGVASFGPPDLGWVNELLM